MIITTLKNLVCQTANVGSKQLTNSADRIGTGFPMVIGTHTATFLSQGYIPVSQLPEPEPVLESRQEVTTMPTALMTLTGIPTSLVGSDFGTRACHHRSTMTPRTPPARVVDMGASRTSYPGFTDRTYRLSSDCQSPDRRLDTADQTAWQPQVAWQRKTNPAAEAKK